MTTKKPPGIWILAIVILAVSVGIGCAQKIKPLPSLNLAARINSTFVIAKKGILNSPEFLRILPSRSVNIQAVILPIARSSDTIPLWNILDKLSEKEEELMKISVSTGSREIVYYENRYTLLSYDTQAECEKKHGLWDEERLVCKAVTRKRISDREVGLGLKLMNTETGEVTIIAAQTKIAIDGVSIIAPEGYQIEIVERPNGIRWNYWNTLYRVISPENMVVIKNNYPRETTEVVSRIVRGKPVKETKKIVRGFTYVPHSDYFERVGNKEILVEAGKKYDQNTVAQSFSKLRELGVKSKSFPDKLVADVEYLYPRFFERLVLLEQGDLTEFQIDPQKTAERVLMILGANGENAWKYTCNRADACGWIQFTPKTYKNIRLAFPSAKLITDFKTGAGNHLNSMMAAILLIDYNLSDLKKRYGTKILEDHVLLQKAFAGTYNGSPRHVWRTLDADLGKTVVNWLKYLKKETHGFFFKLDYLIENDLP